MDRLPHSLVSTAWLAENIDLPGLVVLDASLHLPAAKRDPVSEYRTGHIPGARLFDLKRLIDTSSPVPQALPTAEQLGAYLAELGVGDESAIVVYDDSAVRTSARAWFLLRAHGFREVAVLDGGLAKWRHEQRPLATGDPAIVPTEPPKLTPPSAVRFKRDLLANLEHQTEQVVDARSADRVFGEGIDPVHGGLNGRIPGSLNVPFTALYSPDGTLKDREHLQTAFEQAGVALDRPIVTTCGSGVTACVLLLALEQLGHRATALYDGSWLDWSSDPDTPKESGPA